MSEALKEAAVVAAVNAASSVNTTDLSREQIKDIAANLKPAAAEPIPWQLIRPVITAIGTALATKGLISQDDLQMYTGIVTAAAPLVWNIARILLARRGISLTLL